MKSLLTTIVLALVFSFQTFAQDQDTTHTSLSTELNDLVKINDGLAIAFDSISYTLESQNTTMQNLLIFNQFIKEEGNNKGKSIFQMWGWYIVIVPIALIIVFSIWFVQKTNDFSLKRALSETEIIEIHKTDNDGKYQLVKQSHEIENNSRLIVLLSGIVTVILSLIIIPTYLFISIVGSRWISPISLVHY